MDFCGSPRSPRHHPAFHDLCQIDGNRPVKAVTSGSEPDSRRPGNTRRSIHTLTPVVVHCVPCNGVESLKENETSAPVGKKIPKRKHVITIAVAALVLVIVGVILSSVLMYSKKEGRHQSSFEIGKSRPAAVSMTTSSTPTATTTASPT
eukprot:RCo055733